MARSTGRIFLSYRREETRHIAGRLADRLADRYGAAQVFMDVDSIEPGIDFAEAIDRAVSSCDVLIALIGPHWTTVADQQGRRRLDDPDDFVVLELQAALDRNIRVIPVLTDGADMPHRQDLPDALVPLARRNAIRLDHESFRSDAARLVESLDRLLATDREAATAAGTVHAGDAVRDGDIVHVGDVVAAVDVADSPEPEWRAELAAKRRSSREVRLERGTASHLVGYHNRLHKEWVTVDGVEVATSKSWTTQRGYFDFDLVPERSAVRLNARVGDWGQVTGLRIVVDGAEVYREGFPGIAMAHYANLPAPIRHLATAIAEFAYFDRIHLYPHLDGTKLANARDSAQVPDSAFVVAVIDLSVNRSWWESLLVCDSGLYLRNQGSTEHVGYPELIRAGISVVADTGFSRLVAVGDQQLDLTGMGVPAALVVTMLEDIKAALRRGP